MSETNNLHMVPWKLVGDWSCKFCGKCCINHRIPLLFEEYARIEPRYGPRSVEPGEKCFYIRLLRDGRCFFLRRQGEKYLCRIHNEKPYVCRMFPFRILSSPKYGDESLSKLQYDNEVFYVYLNAECSGIVLGSPSKKFVEETLPEFVRLYEAYVEKIFAKKIVEKQSLLKTA